MSKSLFTSLFLSFIMLLLLSVFIISRNIPNLPMFITSTIWTFFITFILFMIYWKGKISSYRSTFFVIYAFSFVLVFISHLIETRGGMALTEEMLKNKEVPLCPVAIPMLLLPILIKKILIFPTKLINGYYGGFYSIFFMWFVGILALGRGWCSWVCFYGGIDEGFSKVCRKEIISTKNINPKLRYFSFAFLLIIIIWSFISMSPVYCEWLCPLKLVTEYVEITNLITYFQAIIFITLGMGLLIILPILTKKRTQCGLFCPLGAMNSIIGQFINLYRIKINKKCKKCKKCKNVCPVFAITDELLAKNKVSITCIRCGKCMDVCPEKAINYSLLGIPFSSDNKIFSSKFSKKILVFPLRFIEEIFDARTLFIFGALLFGSIISGNMVAEAMVRVYNLFVSGSLLLK